MTDSTPTTSFYLFDALGSTDRLLNAAQSVTDSYLYKAFGEVVASTGSTTNYFKWVGQLGYFAPAGDSLHYYVRRRWNRNALARWLSVDPIQRRSLTLSAESTSLDLNPYRYAHNSVLGLVDPDGLAAVPRRSTPPPTWPDLGKKWKWDKGQGKYKKGGRYRDWDTTQNHTPHWNDTDKNGNDKVDIYLCPVTKPAPAPAPSPGWDWGWDLPDVDWGTVGKVVLVTTVIVGGVAVIAITGGGLTGPVVGAATIAVAPVLIGTGE